MTRMLFCTSPAPGGFHPMFALARAARAAGHDVAFVTGPEHGAAVTGAGMTLFATTGDPRAVMQQRYPDVNVPPRTDADSVFVRRRYFGEVMVELMLPTLIDAFASWRPHVVVRSHLMIAPWIAAEEHGIPHVALDDYSSGEPVRRLSIWREALLWWCDQRGIRPERTGEPLSRYLVLVPFPPSLRHPDSYWSAAARRLRPLIYSEERRAHPAWLDEPRDRPLVHASLGTLNDRPELLRAIIDGLADEPLTLVLTTGRTDPAALGALPANVRVERYISHALLLPRCDAIVTHAGAGTLIASIDAGLPMVMVPIFGDQPPNAERAAAAGAGVVLDPASLTPEAVRDAVRAVLQDDGYRAGVQALQAEIAALPSHGEAVGWIAQVAATGAPLPPDGR